MIHKLDWLILNWNFRLSCASFVYLWLVSSTCIPAKILITQYTYEIRRDLIYIYTHLWCHWLWRTAIAKSNCHLTTVSIQSHHTLPCNSSFLHTYNVKIQIHHKDLLRVSEIEQFTIDLMPRNHSYHSATNSLSLHLNTKFCLIKYCYCQTILLCNSVGLSNISDCLTIIHYQHEFFGFATIFFFLFLNSFLPLALRFTF